MTARSQVEAPAFPVSWTIPDDATRTWMLDPIHFPHPLSPLFRTLWGPAYTDGVNRAGREVLSPGFELRVAFQNGYYYESIVINELAAADEADAARAATAAALDRAIDGLMARWQEEWFPRLTATRERLRTAEPADNSPETLIALLDEVEAITREDWLMHFRIVWPSMMAMQRFEDLYADLFGKATTADGQEMLVGQPGTSALAGNALSDLANSMRDAGLADLVVAMAPGDVPALLAASHGGQGMSRAIDDFLDHYGLQQDLFDYMLPTWQEDPSIAVGMLQAYLRTGVDARADHDAAVHRADAALSEARRCLADYPMVVRAEFEAAVASARAAYYLHLEHNVLIDQKGTSLTRLVLLRIGGRLVESGAISRPEDVFVLTYDELRTLAAEPVDHRALVAERWAELDRQRAMEAPAFLGSPPDDAPAATTVERAFLAYAGSVPPAPEAPGELWGIPGSRGTAAGTARVVRTLQDAKALRSGEILVAPTTLPTWTPLFATATAIVTETGGPLSHAAVVAREYGVPAVVGAADATRIIRTGQSITVDGSRGVVVLA